MVNLGDPNRVVFRRMATVRFKAESPYAKRDERSHDSSDIKYQKFLDATSGNNVTRKTVSIAVFGVGRAGS